MFVDEHGRINLAPGRWVVAVCNVLKQPQKCRTSEITVKDSLPLRASHSNQLGCEKR